MGLPLNIDLEQILIHLLNSLILFAALYFILYKPVKKFMDKRAQMYKDIDEETNKNKEEAEKLKADYEEKLADIQKEADEIKEKAKAEMKAEHESEIAKARKEAENIIESAKEKAETEKKNILSSVNDDAWDILTKKAKEKLPRNSTAVYDDFLKAAEEQKDEK